MINKDNLIQLLQNGSVEEFNNFRTSSNNDLLDLSEADLRNCELTGANLSNVDLSGSDFSESDLTETDFSSSDLSSVDFTGSTIKKTDFIKSVLSGVKFNQAKLNECDFTEANFNGTDLSETNLSGSDLTYAENLNDCIFDSYTTWPDSEFLPEDFNTEYTEDLSSLKDDDDMFESDFAY